MIDNQVVIGGGKISWIASLRGLLVFFVFFSHQVALPIDKDVLFVFGKIGVAGFFAMSGILAKNALEKRTIPQYAFNRFLRLYLIYWMLLLATVALSPYGTYSIGQIIANVTLFQQYLRFENIIGASWMLSIMVILYAVLAACKKNPINYVPIAFWSLCLCAILCGLGRHLSGKPLPTAIFLMSSVGCMGYIFKNAGEKYSALKIYIVVFEITLAIASWLSYDARCPLYLLSYNTAFTLIYLFRKYEVNSFALIFLGASGFTFFLAPDIPVRILGMIIPSANKLPSYWAVSLKFIMAIPFAWAITKYIETPMLKWGKKIEKRI